MNLQKALPSRRSLLEFSGDSSDAKFSRLCGWGEGGRSSGETSHISARTGGQRVVDLPLVPSSRLRVLTNIWREAGREMRNNTAAAKMLGDGKAGAGSNYSAVITSAGGLMGGCRRPTTPPPPDDHALAIIHVSALKQSNVILSVGVFSNYICRRWLLISDRDFEPPISVVRKNFIPDLQSSSELIPSLSLLYARLRQHLAWTPATLELMQHVIAKRKYTFKGPVYLELFSALCHTYQAFPWPAVTNKGLVGSWSLCGGDLHRSSKYTPPPHVGWPSMTENDGERERVVQLQKGGGGWRGKASRHSWRLCVGSYALYKLSLEPRCSRRRSEDYPSGFNHHDSLLVSTEERRIRRAGARRLSTYRSDRNVMNSGVVFDVSLHRTGMMMGRLHPYTLLFSPFHLDHVRTNPNPRYNSPRLSEQTVRPRRDLSFGANIGAVAHRESRDALPGNVHPHRSPRSLTHASLISDANSGTPWDDNEGAFISRGCWFNPGRVTSDLRKWKSCRMMPLVGEFSRGSLNPPPPRSTLSFRHCSIFTSITLIGSLDLYSKSCPNLFTHSYSLNAVLPVSMPISRFPFLDIVLSAAPITIMMSPISSMSTQTCLVKLLSPDIHSDLARILTIVRNNPVVLGTMTCSSSIELRYASLYYAARIVTDLSVLELQVSQWHLKVGLSRDIARTVLFPPVYALLWARLQSTCWSAEAAEKRGRDKGDTTSRIKCAVAAKCTALTLRARERERERTRHDTTRHALFPGSPVTWWRVAARTPRRRTADDETCRGRGGQHRFLRGQTSDLHITAASPSRAGQGLSNNKIRSLLSPPKDENAARRYRHSRLAAMAHLKHVAFSPISLPHSSPSNSCGTTDDVVRATLRTPLTARKYSDVHCIEDGRNPTLCTLGPVCLKAKVADGAGNGRSLRKPADKRYRPTRFPHAKIRERPGRGLNSDSIGGSSGMLVSAVTSWVMGAQMPPPPHMCSVVRLVVLSSVCLQYDLCCGNKQRLPNLQLYIACEPPLARALRHPAEQISTSLCPADLYASPPKCWVLQVCPSRCCNFSGQQCTWEHLPKRLTRLALGSGLHAKRGERRRKWMKSCACIRERGRRNNWLPHAALKGAAYLEVFSAFEEGKRTSYKDYIDTRGGCPFALTR
ncbi:hypothetical protein PR048_019228 [Dryococelus australis]|uniref:Uncharacterized protein n=1 Tax=Dryococelus australis TaxID=614101 RepID=A0ABQ9H2Y6_9NEOP|nr:hypothetical protein PR048_019228 [Dryococelus australis]